MTLVIESLKLKNKKWALRGSRKLCYFNANRDWCCFTFCESHQISIRQGTLETSSTRIFLANPVSQLLSILRRTHHSQGHFMNASFNTTRMFSLAPAISGWKYNFILYLKRIIWVSYGNGLHTKILMRTNYTFQVLK